MKTDQNSTTEITWTWADQISSYSFWGILLFYLFLMIPHVISSYFIPYMNFGYGLDSKIAGNMITIRSFAGFGGLWLAWFMVRMKNHYLLYLFSSFTIIGLLLMAFIPSLVSFIIGFILLGLGFGAISLAIPTILSGGRGGSEMFVVSFGIVVLFERIIGQSTKIFPMGIESFRTLVIIGLVSAIIGSLFLIPVKRYLFNTNPVKREFALTPKLRNPLAVALLSLIPFWSTYYIIYLSYRYHGEVNSINPTQNILSPRAAAWCIFLIPFLPPIIMSSLNSSLTPKLLSSSTLKFHKTWVVVLWACILLPVSFALIQSNMNKLINNKSN